MLLGKYSLPPIDVREKNCEICPVSVEKGALISVALFLSRSLKEWSFASAQTQARQRFDATASPMINAARLDRSSNIQSAAIAESEIFASCKRVSSTFVIFFLTAQIFAQM